MNPQTQRLFYKIARLTTIQTSLNTQTIFSAGDHNLLEYSSQPLNSQLLGADIQGSTLAICSQAITHIAYDPYGHHRLQGTSPLFSGFTGQFWLEPIKGYLLGNGHRLFRPTLRLFFSPDRLSPFEEGGLNAYTYCGADPVNRVDPSGKAFFLTSPIRSLIGKYRFKTLTKKLHTPDSTFSRKEYNALQTGLNKRRQAMGKAYKIDALTFKEAMNSSTNPSLLENIPETTSPTLQHTLDHNANTLLFNSLTEINGAPKRRYMLPAEVSNLMKLTLEQRLSALRGP